MYKLMSSQELLITVWGLDKKVGVLRRGTCNLYSSVWWCF